MVQPGLAAGLARVEVQEKVERQRRPDTRFVMPLDEVLRQLLAECTNYQAAKVLGIPEVGRLQEARERLKVPMPWCSRPKEFTLAAGRVAQCRWAMWQERVPDPISKDELLALIEAEMGKVTPSGQEEGPRPVLERRTKKGVMQLRQERAEALAASLTPGALLVEVRRWYEERGYFPQISELAAALSRSPNLIAERARALEAQGLLDLEKDRLVVRDGVAGGAVIRQTWPREQLDAHLLALGIDPRPGVKRPVKPTEETQPATPATPEEVQPPMDERLAAQDELLPDEQPSPASTPARPGVRRIDWPSDRELVDEAEAIAARGESISKVLCARLGVKDGPLWNRIGDARVRLGLPRKMGIKNNQYRATKAEQAAPAQQTAPSVKLAEHFCDTCKDTGLVGGGQSGPPCTCVEGERVKATLHEERETNQARPMLSSIAEPSSGPREGGSSAEQTPASETATDAQEGKIIEAQFAEFRDDEGLIAKLERQVDDLQERLGLKLRRIASLEGDVERLTAAIKQVVTEASAPVLLLQYKGAVREVSLPEGQALLSVGDHYAEQVDVDGRRRVAIWECTGTGIVGGRIVCICKLIKAAPQAREAA